MDDLASVVSSAVAPSASFKVPPAVQASRDVDRLAILRDELSKTTNQDDRDAIGREIARATGGKPTKAPGQQTAQSTADAFGDLASVVGGAVTEQPQSAQAPAVAPRAVLAQPKPAEQPGQLASFGAGAGKAMGTGALAVQQLLGKGASYLGGIGQDTTVKDLVVPREQTTLEKVGSWLQNDAAEGIKKLAGENAPYAEANPKTNFAGELTGMVASPVNKLVPGAGPAAGLVGTLTKGALTGGALAALTTPVENTDQPFITEKLKQFGAGAVGGAAGSAVAAGVSALLNKGISALKTAGAKLTSGSPTKAAEELVDKVLTAQGIPPSAAPQGLVDGLKIQVSDAIKSSGKVDPEALTRLARAQTLPVPVPMLKGQITRDAMQFAKEQNLRGIQGVGEPITQTLTAQNRALIQNLDAIGATRGTDVVNAGAGLIGTLRSADDKLRGGVTAAYDAFKNHTGKELEVPLQGLAQDYAAAVKSFGDEIPSAVRKQFDALGLLSGKQSKTFSISDAEALLKDINRNYDPIKKAQANSLDDLRRSVQKAIYEGAGEGAGGDAAGLAKAARQAAKARFDLIDSTPALKDAINGIEPDKFIQKHILQGSVGQIRSMASTLHKESPQALETIQDSVLRLIKERVINKSTDGNGIFSQAQLKNFVSDANMAGRLSEVLGPQKMAQLKQLNQVAEDALFAPKASAVNTSNTASAGANLVQEAVKGGALNRLYDVAKGVPGLSHAATSLQAGNQATRAASLIGEAVNPTLTKPKQGTSLVDMAALGARAGSSAVSERQQKRAQQ